MTTLKVVTPDNLGLEFGFGTETPNKITLVPATDTAPGKVRLATDAEAAAGTNGGTVKPSQLKAGLDALATAIDIRLDADEIALAAAQALLASALQRNGSVAPTADLPMAGNGLTGMRAAGANGEAVRYDEFKLIPNYATRAIAAAASIPAGIAAFQTLGYATVDDGGAAIYVRKTATSLLDFTDAAGGPWSLAKDQQINAHMFGAVGDATYNNITMATSGADDAAAIQSMIDWAIRSHVADVYLLDRFYLITKQLHLGYGQAFYTIRLHGTRMGSYKVGTAGTAIIPTMTDRSAINVQGCRDSAVTGIAFAGQNFAYAANMAAAGNLSSLASDWLDPLLAKAGVNPGGLQPHSPYAAITIDGYSGAAPADPYAADPYPAWTGIVAPYNKLQSSHTVIENCGFYGFAVGIMQSPNGNTQGDYLEVNDNWFFSCVYCIAVANAQSRNVPIVNNKYFFTHTFITTAVFGTASGELIGPISNNSGSTSYQTLLLTNGFAGPLEIKSLYFEVQVRLGEIGNGVVATNYPVEFAHGIFNFGQLGHGINPAALLKCATNQHVKFSRNQFKGLSRIANLVEGNVNVTLDGNLFLPELYGMTGAVNGNVPNQIAINYCGGVFVNGHHLPGTSPSTVGLLRLEGGNHAPYLPLTTSSPLSSASTQVLSEELSFLGGGVFRNRRQRTQGSKGFTDAQNRRWHFEGNLNTVITFASLASVQPAFAGDVMTFTATNTLQNNSTYRLAVGDMIYAVTTATLFLVTAVAAVADGLGNWPITCRQLNNMTMTKDANATLVTNLCADLTLAGSIVIYHVSPIISAQVEYGTFTAGSPNVTTISRGDAFAGDLATYHIAGDQLMGLNFNSAALALWPINALGKTDILTVTPGSPGSLTLSVNALASGVFPISSIPIR